MNAGLISKLQKVLAMTSSPVEAEAQTAAEILHRLLLEHNLSIADLEKKGAKTPTIQKEGYDLGKAAFQWKLDLATTLAGHYFCHGIIGYDKTVAFIGRPENVESLKMLYGWVIDQVKRISASERQRHQEETGEHIDPLRWQVNFGAGVVSRLGRRLQELRDKERADATSFALVKHHETEISDWLEEQGEYRIDGQLTKEQRQWRAQREEEQRKDDELLKRDPKAYYAKYPWRDPEVIEAERIKEEKKEKRRRNRVPRGYGRERKIDWEKEAQADKAHSAGHRSADKVNLQPFIKDSERATRKGIK